MYGRGEKCIVLFERHFTSGNIPAQLFSRVGISKKGLSGETLQTIFFKVTFLNSNLAKKLINATFIGFSKAGGKGMYKRLLKNYIQLFADLLISQITEMLNNRAQYTIDKYQALSCYPEHTMRP